MLFDIFVKLYVKLENVLGIRSLFMKAGTFIVPYIFLIVDYVYAMRREIL